MQRLVLASVFAFVVMGCKARQASRSATLDDGAADAAAAPCVPATDTPNMAQILVAIDRIQSPDTPSTPPSDQESAFALQGEADFDGVINAANRQQEIDALKAQIDDLYKGAKSALDRRDFDTARQLATEGKTLQARLATLNADCALKAADHAAITGAPIKVVAADSIACALTDMKEVLCWGGSRKQAPTIRHATGVDDVAITNYFNVCVLENGKVRCGGKSYEVEPTALNGAKRLIGATESLCGIMADDTIKCSGPTSYTAFAVANDVPRDAVLAMDSSHDSSCSSACAILKNKSLACWGDGLAYWDFRVRRRVPVADVNAVATTDWITCTILDRGRVQCFTFKHGLEGNKSVDDLRKGQVGYRPAAAIKGLTLPGSATMIEADGTDICAAGADSIGCSSVNLRRYGVDDHWVYTVMQLATPQLKGITSLAVLSGGACATSSVGVTCWTFEKYEKPGPVWTVPAALQR